MRLHEPPVVSVEHLVGGPDTAPLAGAEDAERVVAVLADAVQLRRVRPRLGQVFVCKEA